MGYEMSLQDRLRAVGKERDLTALLHLAAERLDTLEAQVIELRNAAIVMEAIRRDLKQ